MNFLGDTGFANLAWQQAVMLLISFVLMYLGIVKQYEPLLMIPIAFGMFLANFPLGGVNDLPSETLRLLATVPEYMSHADLTANFSTAMVSGEHLLQRMNEAGVYEVYAVKSTYGGLLYYLGRGVKLGIYPPLIFMGIGAMTDFAPLIANPKSILLGGAAQLGIFGAYIGACLLGFTPQEAGSIGIIGGADGPTALYLTAKLADHLLGPIAVAAYSYMALVPVIQPPIMKALTTKRERNIIMSMANLRPVSKTEKIIFPIAVTTLVGLILPSTVPLLGMLMFGNLMKESGVVERISKTAQNELMNIVTIFLGISVGSTATADAFLNMKTLGIMLMGVTAFALGSAGGVMMAKLMNTLMGGNAINPLIGSAGVSAVPMAARVSQVVGQKENPSNFLLMHAMGPNVTGVIGSAIAAGILLSVLG
ncbi:MAG: sodium ion-translocating decarboxylase subunit beta [Oscillospiraceae bacterium]|nr:sodium ion-translocating decarboxylase subunit beta [Oscillospiraceae bacterium]